MKKLTQEYLKECFEYSAETGELHWKERPREHFKTGKQDGKTAWKTWNSQNAGKLVSSVNSSGYLRANIGGTRYSAHRIIWQLVHGYAPKGELDHINGDRTDNRICNLREVDHQGNMKNLARRSDNSSGITGVSYAKRDGVYIAYITIDKRMSVIGRFKTLEEAADARKEAEAKQGFHENHGRAAA